MRYTMHDEDGSEAGDAAYADSVRLGDELMLGPGRFREGARCRPEDAQNSPDLALLEVEAA